jgi:hypothetical protein
LGRLGEQPLLLLEGPPDALEDELELLSPLELLEDNPEPCLPASRVERDILSRLRFRVYTFTKATCCQSSGCDARLRAVDMAETIHVESNVHSPLGTGTRPITRGR